MTDHTSRLDHPTSANSNPWGRHADHAEYQAQLARDVAADLAIHQPDDTTSTTW